ncbi:MAG TPA: Ig-like domain-containing protein [Gemmatimonadales bacterium]|nr:Ig-like domain-containing protein [Gemmatimonadales bacterium]
MLRCIGVALISLAALTSCADDIVPPGPAPHVRIAGGDAQSGVALDALAVPLQVTVVDDEGTPVVGRPVAWSTDDVAGRLIPHGPVTDANGRVRAVWILGFESGAQSAQVVVAGEDGGVTFHATASARAGFKAIGLMHGAAGGHMCALAVDSLAWCWGTNVYGQLGDGSNDAAGTPRQVVGGRRFAQIIGDPFHTCARASSGELWCWGLNSYTGPVLRGLFGNGSTESSTVPVRGALGLLLRNFDMESRFSCGVTLDGRAFCWGEGDGALGGGSGFSAELPLEITGDRAWREIAVSQDYRCAIGEDNRAYCWADPDHSRWRSIGVPREAGPHNVPLLVEITGPLVDISVGAYGPCGISLAGAGTGVCWGAGAGDPPPGPTSIRLGSGVRKFVSDGYGRAALDAQGQLWVWGTSCCDPAAGRGAPTLLFPGIEWSDISLANGVHAISARDSVVYSLGPLTEPLDAASFELKPVPVP